ncbi:MAG TPA: cation:proton antiporter, partial [Burkholderiaceae bacterium]|nr:cation:proton antiporter [Burkholderiaceae bacterium]
EALLFFTLLQLAIIVLAARAGGALALRWGQSAVVGEIAVGVLLGPSLFGALAPQAFATVFRSTPAEPLTILSQVGLLLLMFQIGLEFDFSHLAERTHRRTVWAVASAGLAAPFAIGAAFGVLVPRELAGTDNRLGFVLFVATAFSITALPVLGRILVDFKLTRNALGVIAISCAAINDVVGWLMLALVSALSVSAFAPGPFALRVLGIAALGALAWWVLRPLLVAFVRRRLRAASATDGNALPPTLMGAILACVFVAGMTTYQLGIFAIFGGFLMGVLLHRETAFVRAWHARVGSFVNVFFVPIFFTLTGLRTDIGSLHDGPAWAWCVLLIALATAAKLGACYVAARAVGLDGVRARIIGMLMNTRGLMELIVINIGLEMGMIGHQVFTMLVLMALFSTVITSPALRRWLPRLHAHTEGAQPGALGERG